MTLSADDVKQLRKLAADRDYQQARADEAIRQRDAWKDSAANWQKLYLAEKDRADRVQGGRVAELEKAISAYKDQAAADRERLGEMEFKIRKLKGERKWWLALGAVAGGIGGWQLAKIRF